MVLDSLSLRARDVLIIGYLAVQVVVPARGLLWDRIEDPGRFSWNMYTHRRACEVSHVLYPDNGAPVEIDHRAMFQRPEHASRVITRTALPGFHAFLCEAVAEQGFVGEIRASAACSLDGAEPVQLVRTGIDVCTADNYGVFHAGE